MRANPLPTYPQSLLEFQRMFPTDAACARYLAEIRWPNGFACPKCGVMDYPYVVATRGLLECRACRHQTSVTAGTIMHRTKQPLRIWFWGAYLVATSTPGLSALEFRKQLGISRYETAYMLLRKLREGMTRPNQDKIGGDYPVELDIAYVGGVNRGEGRGKTRKSLVIIAVEMREGAPPKNLREKQQRFYAGRLRMRKILDKKARTVEKFVRDWIEPGSVVLSDADQSYMGLNEMGYVHEWLVTGKDKETIESWVPLVHLVISNLKAWLLGTYHGAVRKQHLQEYLNEYVFRFNRRFNRMRSFRTLLQIGAETPAVTYRDHYDGLADVRENPGDWWSVADDGAYSVLPADLLRFGFLPVWAEQ